MMIDTFYGVIPCEEMRGRNRYVQWFRPFKKSTTNPRRLHDQLIFSEGYIGGSPRPIGVSPPTSVATFRS